ncbi:MAG: STAS domain-containing protein [Gammaproteobacteria bacterium]
MARRKITPATAAGEDSPARKQEEPAPAAAVTPAAIATTGTSDPIVLEAVITIAEAAALKDQLAAHINRKGEVVLDGTRVASVDTAGLQVLLAFVRALQGQGAVVRWNGVSPALVNTAQLLGLEEQIGLRA